MPVSSTHPDYDTWSPKWTKCRDFFSGEDEVKEKKTAYLRSPSGFKDTSDRYILFLHMAKFFPAVSRTIEGYEGLVFRNDLQVNIGNEERLQAVVDNLTYTGVSMNAYARRVLCERILIGRYGELVDYQSGNGSELGRAFSKGYKAEDIINWRVEHIGGLPKLVLVVLTENRQEKEDEFSSKDYTVYRVLDLGDDPHVAPHYRVREFRIEDDDGNSQEVQVGDDKYPDFNGEPITEIPFKFYGVRENSPAIERPPMLDMVNIVMHDFHNSANLEWGRQMTSLPQMWRAGFSDEESDEIEVGSTVVWDAASPDAKAGMVEYSGQGLGALETAIEENRREMAQLGASLLEQDRKAVEASDTHRIRHSNRTSFLQAMAELQSEGHTDCLKWAAMYMGLSEAAIDEISAELNKDYFAVALDHNQMKAFMELYLGGRITKHTLFERLQTGEIIGSNETFDDYEAVLAEENAGLGDEVL